MSISRSRFVPAALAAFLTLAAGSLPAQTPPPSPEGDGRWHFVAGLYGFFPAIDGTATTRDFIQVPIDVTFSELWDHLKMNLTGHLEAQHGRLGFGIDAFYVRLGADIDGPIGELIDAEVTMRQFIGEAFGYYQLFRGEGEHPWSLEALGGRFVERRLLQREVVELHRALALVELDREIRRLRVERRRIEGMRRQLRLARERLQRGLVRILVA